MDDELLASRAAAGDADALGQLFDRYFAPVHDVCWRITRDIDAAAAVTREVLGNVRDGLASAARAASFRDWILGLAARRALERAEALTGGVQPEHEEAFGAFGVPDPCRLLDPKLARGDAELPCLVWEGATTLARRDYAVLDLHLRQGLDAQALASLMGTTRAQAKEVLARLRDGASSVILTYVLARRGGKDCEPLRRILAEHGFPPLSEGLRAAIEAHARECETCRRSMQLPSA
ncbi:MAG TPA: hypothetical protein VFC53_01005, partial [Dehalococcoidia bacterium]|nr:hypothetical protein [Dehalococcoidia bacterium]